jgi:MoxR-like ATPase
MANPVAAKSFETTVKVDKSNNRGYFTEPQTSIPTELWHNGYIDLKARAEPFHNGQIIKVQLRYTDDAVFVMRAKAISDEDMPKVDGDENTQPSQAGFYGDHWFDSKSIEFLKTVDKISAVGGPILVTLKGGSGYGKSSIAKAFADQTGREFLRVNAPDVRDPEEWYGVRNAHDGSTGFDLTPLSKAWTKGNHVILVDEINRVEPVIANALLPLFDFSHGLDIHNHAIYGGANTIVFITMNEGFKFTGTFQIDVALVNRSIGTVIVGAPPQKVEEEILIRKTGLEAGMAKRVIDAMIDLRKQNDDGFDASPRAALNIAMLINAGLNPRLAFEVAIIANAANPKNATDAINSKFGLLKS